MKTKTNKIVPLEKPLTRPQRHVIGEIERLTEEVQNTWDRLDDQVGELRRKVVAANKMGLKIPDKRINCGDAYDICDDIIGRTKRKMSIIKLLWLWKQSQLIRKGKGSYSIEQLRL